MTPPVADSWMVNISRVAQPPEAETVRMARQLLAQLGDAPDDGAVQLNVGVLRDLLRGLTMPPARVAVITDERRRVTYEVEPERGDAARWVKRVTVIPWDEPPAPSAFKSPVPVQALADQAAAVLDKTADTTLLLLSPVQGPNGEESWTVGHPAEVALRPSRIPATPEELREWVREGRTRKEIAELTNRSMTTVDGWLLAARRNRPDLDWPAPKRGPKAEGHPLHEARARKARATTGTTGKTTPKSPKTDQTSSSTEPKE